MKVFLKKMEMHNFKCIKEKTLCFNSCNNVISGRNGSGKTTVYEAYYWCLFGKTVALNGVVQMLDKDNCIVHKVETSVTVTLDVEGKSIEIRRVLSEKWKADGTPNEKLIGTEVQRYWNQVPLSMSDFKAKMNGIIPVIKWQLLSNISSFMSYKTEDKRKILMSMAKNINEKKLMEKYDILSNSSSEGKTIEEISVQAKNTKKVSMKELLEIPARIAAQDSLKVETDMADGGDISDIQEFLKKEKELISSINDKKKEWEEKRQKEISANNKLKYQYQNELDKAKANKQKHIDDNISQTEKYNTLLLKFSDKKKEWIKVNDEVFDFASSDKCPVCGAVLTEDFKTKELNNAVTEFNRRKSERLSSLQQEANVLAEQKSAIKGSMNEFDKITKEQDIKEISIKKKSLDNTESEAIRLNNLTYESDERIKKMEENLKEYQSKKPKNTELIIKSLADKEINLRVNEEKNKLNKRSSELTAIISNCDKMLWQIFNFKKDIATASEQEINKLFSLVTWKFYQKNITDDNLQEVCSCLVNGIDYNNVNQALRMNMGIDIISGLSKFAEVEVPLFIDCAESCNSIIEHKQQAILLKVTDKDFILQNNN